MSFHTFASTAEAHDTEPKTLPNGDALSSGFKVLNDGDSNKALELFNAAARQHPDSAEAHHGRARALAALGRKEEAVKEFKLSILLNPSDEIARKSKEGLKGLGEIVPESTAARRPTVSTPETVRAGDVEQSINKILKQSEEKIKDIQSSSESYASAVYNARSNAHNRLMEQARQEAEEMKRSRVRFGRRFIPAFSQADINQRQAELQYRSMSSLERSKADYESRKSDAQSRSLGIKQSAEGLQSQMLNKPSENSGVFLMPTGTNLYVRNYGHFDPVLPEPPEALHAVPLKLPEVLKMQEEHSSKKGHRSSLKEPNAQASSE
ncbi:MAG: tetratricopeptide repeat protein [Candidatus Obscuribacterales bacterium]|nr:tetratricopeptide repeat protein [Candidatus Obscuribacterales bacterium]